MSRMRTTGIVTAVLLVALLVWWAVTRDALPVFLGLVVVVGAACVYFVETARHDSRSVDRATRESSMRRSTMNPPERPRF